MDTGVLISVLGGLGAMLGWGISDFFAKKCVDKIGNMRSLIWMQILGIIPLLFFFLLNPDFSGLSVHNILIVSVLAIIDIVGYILFYKSLEKGKVSIVSPVTASYSAFAVLISATVFGEKLPSQIVAILGLIFLGIILSSIDFTELKKEGISWKDLTKGIPEALLGVVFFAIWFPLWDNFLIGKNWILMLIILRTVSSIFLLTTRKVNKKPVRINNKAVFKWLVIIGTLDSAAYFALSWGYSFGTQASIVSVLSATFSVPTLIMARIILKEKIKVNQVIGIGMILAGLALLGIA